ncbi:MAG: hypothetical protein JOZ54_15590 [Acidobacteria bacterium]|nr:hypothetical protein [Acidobacteriota bacterium]
MRATLPELPEDVPEVPAPALFKVDGSVLLYPIRQSFVPSSYLINRSCWEQWHNRIDLFGDIDRLVEGIGIAAALRRELAGFPERAFVIRVSWDPEETTKCRVSFWQQRHESVFAPIEGFLLEAIGEIHVG